jgi:signal peptidase I
MKTIPFLIVAAVAITLNALPVRPIVVTGHSMEPSLSHLQVVLGNRSFRELKRGDVVVLDTPSGTAIKRIAFMQGDIIPQYFWGGEWVTPTSGVQGWGYQRLKAKHRDIVVPPGHVWVIGDNLIESSDSRCYGSIPMSAVRFRVDNVPDMGQTVPGAHLANGIVMKRQA